MNINWLGHYTIRVISQGNTLIIDPHSAATGLSATRGKAEIVALTNPHDPDTSHLSGLSDDPFVLSSPGEYTLLDMSVLAKGWHDAKDNERNIQRWEIEGLTLLHIGAVPPNFTLATMPEIEQSDIDVLFLPIGGGETMDTDHALEFVHQVEPHIVVPINYLIPGLKEKIDPVDSFAKEMGIDPASSEPRLSITPHKMPREGTETVILKP